MTPSLHMLHQPTGLLIYLDTPDTKGDLASIMRITTGSEMERAVMRIAMQHDPTLRDLFEMLKKHALCSPPDAAHTPLSTDMRRMAADYLACLDLHPARKALAEPATIRLFLHAMTTRTNAAITLAERPNSYNDTNNQICNVLSK